MRKISGEIEKEYREAIEQMSGKLMDKNKGKRDECVRLYDEILVSVKNLSKNIYKDLHILYNIGNIGKYLLL